MSNSTVSLNLTDNIPSPKTFPRYRSRNIYQGLPDLYDVADGIGSITINDDDELEANLVMELTRARRDVFMAEKSLADCMVCECELMASLSKFKSNISTQKLNKADVGLGYMRITFKKCGISHHVPANRDDASSSVHFGADRNITIQLD
ncbi:hypothetical protein DEU56DRAFT_757670 [Suillus clintonianus]|uniref:uncharacterized protein n=1 Tax=Suillus clintonianus TaxID=1904413 RepID=UPI001B87C300|nr:uncharacterized protein DEU56DRAFT_757670 [Suillus clintonianus]KAG2131042.1 hypothetical protein DEU56DRAFT_757670 [Suillus clintonianus]